MSAKILDGKVVRDEIRETLISQISILTSRPKLVIIQIGDNPESNTYINQKIKFGERIGAIVDHQKFPAGVTQEFLTSQLSILNSDPAVTGVIIQMPTPAYLDREALIDTIDPKKDVDGLTTTNQKLLEENNPAAIIPATAKGVITILNYYKIPIKGKKATVVGRSKLVGAPVATLLKNLGAKVTIGHSQTPDLKTITKPADIIVVAVGKPNLITKDHVSPGQTIIDVGINVVDSAFKARPWKTERPGLETKAEQEGQGLDYDDTKEKGLALSPAKRNLTGDVAFAEVTPIVAAITPVPSGVGPMTVASLFENLLEAYKNQTT